STLPHEIEAQCRFSLVLLAHPLFYGLIHNTRIGIDETEHCAVARDEQICVPDHPILIRRGEGGGTVRVDRVGSGIGYVVEDMVLIGGGADAAHRAVAVKLIFASDGEMGLRT